MHHTPLTWYDQENLGHKGSFLRPSPVLAFLLSPKGDHIDTARRSYKPLHLFTQRFRVRLAPAYADIKECAVAKGCRMISACNLLGRTYILTEISKCPPCKHTNTSYTNKITVISYSFTLLKL